MIEINCRGKSTCQFDPKHTALLVIDMQGDFLLPQGGLASLGYDISHCQSTIPRIRNLLEASRQAELTIVHTCEGWAPDLSDCHELRRTVDPVSVKKGNWGECLFVANPGTNSLTN